MDWIYCVLSRHAYLLVQLKTHISCLVIEIKQFVFYSMLGVSGNWIVMEISSEDILLDDWREGNVTTQSRIGFCMEKSSAWLFQDDLSSEKYSEYSTFVDNLQMMLKI